MSNLTNLPIAQLGPVFKEQGNRITTGLGGPNGVLAGQAVYCDSTAGTSSPTTTATAGMYQFRGIAMQSAGHKQGFDILSRGFMGGVDLSSLAYDALVYLSDTPGMLSSTPGTNTVCVGRVVPSSDFDVETGGPSKLLFIDSLEAGNW